MHHRFVPRLMVGLALSSLGSGLTLPFLFVYLVQVRGLPTQAVALLFAWMGVLSFAATPVTGSAIDRFGPRIVMLGGLVVEAGAVLAMVTVSTLGQALAVTSVLGVASVAVHPSSTALLTRLVPESERERVYGLQFMLMNAGFGVGGVVAAIVIEGVSVASFQRLYVIDAATYLGYIAVLATLPRGTGRMPVEESGSEASTASAGWRHVLADRTLLRVCGVILVLLTFGYAQIETGFTAYVTTVAGVPPAALGWAYAANTAAIVAGQLLVLRMLPGRSRARGLAACAVLWSAAWAIVAWSGVVSGAAALGCVILGLVVFGLGETLWAPLAPALVNSLAREDVRGRYNALLAMMWTLSSIIGPASAGLLIGSGHSGWWVAATVGGCALAGALFLRLRRTLTPGQDGRAPAAAVEAAAPLRP